MTKDKKANPDRVLYKPTLYCMWIKDVEPDIMDCNVRNGRKWNVIQNPEKDKVLR